MKTKPAKTFVEFQTEFQKNINLTLVCKIITSIMFVWALPLFIVFWNDTYSLLRPFMGVFLLLLACLMGILAYARSIQYFGVNRYKIKKKLQKDMQEWQEGIVHLQNYQKNLSKEEYEKHYFIEGVSAKFEEIPERILLCKSNVAITEQKVEYINSQKEKTGWQYILSFEWLNLI